MTDTPKSGALIADEKERKKLLNRLRRLEGQIRGLQTMIDASQDCDAILTQVMAAKSALNQVGLLVVGHAMKRCMVSDDPSLTRDDVIDEAITVFLKYSSCMQL